MRGDTRLGLALWVAMSLQLLPWTQLTRHTGALQLASLTIGAVLLAGWAGRRLRAPQVVLALAQLGVVAAATIVGVGVLHGPTQAGRAHELLVEGIAFIYTSAAPMFPHPGATTVIVAGVGLLAVVADWLAVTSGRPGWAALPLVAMYAVVAIGLATATLFGEFVLLAAGIVLTLVAAAPLPDGEGVATRAAAWGTAVAVAAASVGLTWAVATLVPTLETRRTSEPLQMNDPSLDLKRNLVQGSDEVVIRYTTDIPDGAYLKLATLPALTTGGFALSDVRVATGRIPAPAGAPGGVPRTTQVEIGAFRSEWLPVPFAPTAVDAPGRWGFALDTLDVMALAGPERGSATEGISYEVRSLDVRPQPDAVAAASADAGQGRELTLALPSELPGRVRALARDVTAGAGTAGAKAQALEAYLRSGRFTYSTAPATGIGDGLATIDDFLFRSRRGYCEQFAGAMAILAREVGIPTRMAVGFVPGTQEGDEWHVTARDLHTWPELWLDGLGWVAFEPTPTRGSADGAPAPTAAPTGTAAPTPEASEEATPTPEPAEPSAEGSPAPSPLGPVGDAVVAALPWVLAALFVLGLVVGGLVAPRWLRAHRRSRRLAGTGDARVDTLLAWDEVRDSATDAGVGWPDGSPRFAAERFVRHLGSDGAAAESLRRLAAASERALFDRSDSYDGQGSWVGEVTAIRAALKARENENARPRRAKKG